MAPRMMHGCRRSGGTQSVASSQHVQIDVANWHTNLSTAHRSRREKTSRDCHQIRRERSISLKNRTKLTNMSPRPQRHSRHASLGSTPHSLLLRPGCREQSVPVRVASAMVHLCVRRCASAPTLASQDRRNWCSSQRARSWDSYILRVRWRRRTPTVSHNDAWTPHLDPWEYSSASHSTN
jgi:hypothetical protein